MADSYPRIAQVVLDTRDARRLAEFYRELFGLEYRESDEPPPLRFDRHEDPDEPLYVFADPGHPFCIFVG